MNNSKYEAVRAKIVEACELSQSSVCESCNGCGIEWPIGSPHYRYYRKCLECEGVGKFGTDEQIRLSHVLRAIREVEDRKGYFIRVEASGGMRWIKQFENDTYVSCRYDLTKDDLSLQSTDTIDFLFKILCE